MTSDQLEPGTLSAVQFSCGELYAPKLHTADTRWDGTVSLLVASSAGISYKRLAANFFLKQPEAATKRVWLAGWEP